MPPAASLSDGLAEARSFAQSVAGVLDRQSKESVEWAPGDRALERWPELAGSLDKLGWHSVSRDSELVAFAGLGAAELGLRLAPLEHVDALLGASPIAGELIRSLVGDRLVVARMDGAVVRRPLLRYDPCASAEGLDVQRVLELGEPEPVSAESWAVALGAWIAAGVGYLAGVGQGALDLTVDYVRQRRAFGSTLAGLGPVQQQLAGAVTAVRGVRLLAGEGPDADALAYAGPAVARACAACQQVTGALGFTLEYPLHRYTQRARALASWNDALLDCLIGD